MTHICVSRLTSIGSDNGLSPGRRQAIIWTNAGILLIGPIGTNLSEISIAIQTFSFQKVHLEMSFGKCRPFCLCPNVLNHNNTLPWLSVNHVCISLDVLTYFLLNDGTLFNAFQKCIFIYIISLHQALKYTQQTTPVLTNYKLSANKWKTRPQRYVWGLWCQKQVSRLWLSNYIPQNTAAPDTCFWHQILHKIHLFLYSGARYAIVQQNKALTHLPLVPHICVSESGQHWLR